MNFSVPKSQVQNIYSKNIKEDKKSADKVKPQDGNKKSQKKEKQTQQQQQQPKPKTPKSIESALNTVSFIDYL